MLLKLLSAPEVVPHVSGHRLHRLLTLHSHYFRTDFEKIRNITNNSEQMTHGCRCLLIHLKNDLSTAAFFFFLVHTTIYVSAFSPLPPLLHTLSIGGKCLRASVSQMEEHCEKKTIRL